jgi:hypothetical protein
VERLDRQLRLDPPLRRQWSGAAGEFEIYLNGQLLDVVSATTLFAYALGGTNTWTVVAVDAAGNSSPPSNAATLTVIADPNLC